MRKTLTLCLAFCALLTGNLRALDYPDPTGKNFARQYPYSMIGQLEFVSGDDYYAGSGTVIKARSVLTAAHNLWDPQTGWSTQLLFTRSRYDDNGLSQQYASRKYILAGYSTSARRYGADDVRTFANDMGGLLFSKPVADGAYAGYWPNTAALTGDVYNIALGYGAEWHLGDELLSMTPRATFYRTYGGFFENESIAVEGGMSGGPVLAADANGSLYVVGVVVAGSTGPTSTGVRALDSKAASFIRAYLR
jgi:V8-like Glu-specific endopeptidase